MRRWPAAQRAMGRLHARLYEISGGRFLPRWFAGAPVMVLETVGRRSGTKRATPVLYLRDGDAFVVLAANAGADRTPAWWLNLRDAQAGEIVVGCSRIRVRPRLLDGAERNRLWHAFVEMYPQAEHYQRFTDRVLPLIALEPAQR
ncbi:nitroreductase/quinone reductase family protein [Mycolicibacterium mageritense]|nr:nitroreductase/quinone reductase family protein [Mycolicibacterium mageritense]TXI58454.1 MAG: nitroreductase family deazaflavin-dependent oxidoreductase [Mycolicibacterium mageritense]